MWCMWRVVPVVWPVAWPCAEVPVPASQYFAPDADPLSHSLPYPVLVKPNSTDGSYGITSLSVCHNPDQLKRALEVRTRQSTRHRYRYRYRDRYCCRSRSRS